MHCEEVLKLLSLHHDELATFGIRRLALFGSVARNEATPKSDVDMLVVFEGEPTFDRYVELNFFLEALLGRKVDLVTESSLRESFRVAIQEDTIDVPRLSPVSC